MIITDLFESPQICPECGGPSFSDLILAEKKDACYHKVKASAKVWPSAYASGRLVQCRKKGADNYGNSKNEGVAEAQLDEKCWDGYQQQGMKNKSGRQVPNCVPAESVNEMDKSQTPPGRDGSNDSDAGKKEYTATLTNQGAVARQGSDILNKAFIDSQRVDPRTGKKMNTKGVAEEYELAGVGVAYELGRRAYKQGMTIRDNPYSATKEARKNDEWAKGLERGKHDANDARHFRSSVREQGVAEEAPPGDKAERMVKHIKKSYAKDGKITDKEKGIAYATAWKAHNAGKVEEAQYDRGDYYNARMAGEYGKGMSASLDGGGGDGPGRGDIHKGQTKHLPADPFGRASGDVPLSSKGKIYTKALPDEMDEGEQQKGADYRDPPEADYGDDYQDMVARVKKLAGLGPLKTVYDPAKRVYRNVPTAQQPKK